MISKTISHYKILEKLGEGGMGVVYRAEDLTLGRTVALKFLPPDSTARDADRMRLVHEARAAAALLHPNICPIHEIAESEGRTFIAMAHIEGRSLKYRIAEGPLPFDEALSIARQIGDALASAHAKGIIHRDIKPANVMLASDGRPMLMDFGLAKVSGATKLTRTGTTMGTVAYMSPEQLQGREADHRSDIWALGAVLYEMVSGRSPFEGEYEAALLYSIMNEDPAPLAAGDIPAGLDGVLAKALAKDPTKRYQGVGEFVADLETLARDHEALPAGRALPAKGLRRLWRRWHPWQRVVAVSVICLFAVAAVYAAVALLSPKAEAIDSIAVLPFENLSGDPGQEYIVDGMTDEIIGQLGKIRALKVISRTSSMQYKGVEKPLPEIARELSVKSILEGSVRRGGDHVRISVNLVNARTDKSIWSDTYDMTIADIFGLQTDVAWQVVHALRATLSPEEKSRLEEKQSANAEAYQLYLKGNYFLNKRAGEETRKAVRCFEQALELDPEYAAAYDGLSSAYYSMSIYGHVSPKETYPKAREYALRALKLDESSAHAHATLASLSMYDWDWKASEKEYSRAIELEPNVAGTRDGYAFFLLQTDRTGEAVVQETRAVELDPLAIGFRQNLGEVLYYARRYDESIKASLETIEMDPEYPQTHMFLGMAYAAQGKIEEAVKALDRDKEISGGRKPEIESWIGVAYALAGQRDRARQIYTDMLQQSKSNFISPFSLACICFVLGDVDKGFEWLEEGYEQHDPRMSFLKVHPACGGVRTDPRYVECLKKMRLGA
jgi:TolB-like protein/cytochrome c-type biogenesis protein CcmH/NrfG/predicted Ser/Thr protein kinase